MLNRLRNFGEAFRARIAEGRRRVDVIVKSERRWRGSLARAFGVSSFATPAERFDGRLPARAKRYLKILWRGHSRDPGPSVDRYYSEPGDCGHPHLTAQDARGCAASLAKDRERGPGPNVEGCTCPAAYEVDGEDHEVGCSRRRHRRVA